MNPRAQQTLARCLLIVAVFCFSSGIRAEQDEPAEGPVLLKYDTLRIPYGLLHVSHAWENGRVVIRIDEKGDVVDWIPLDLPHYKLLPVLKACIGSMEFMPARENGEPVVCDVGLDILFEDSIGMVVSNQTISDHVESRYAELGKDHNRLTVWPAADLDSPVLLKQTGRPFVALDEQGEPMAGTVLVEFYIDPEGKPRMIRIPEASNRATEHAAYKTVSGFTFTPPRVHGKPVITKVRMPIILPGE